MSDIAIRVEHLGKRYHIDGPQIPYKTLRESLMAAAGAPFRWLKKERHKDSTFWALDDVSFEVNYGETVGIIGRNGAGKSTLLRLLSRITKPTRGSIELYGRVGSLLEVGTGFHPELTGRENIYLNGAILGMGRREIGRKFDAIVGFAEIERFLDTPVKFYSSGMYVRLAFAVAAHLEPDILVVDEVLAVGDAQFQKKCLGKMDDVAQAGRAVLFVSHNMQAVSALCVRGLLLHDGNVVLDGEIQGVVKKYLGDAISVEAEVNLRNRIRERQTEIEFEAIRIRNGDGCLEMPVSLVNGCILEIEYRVLSSVQGANIGFALYNTLGECVLTSTDIDMDPRALHNERKSGLYKANCYLSSDFLRAGSYSIDLGASIPNDRMLDSISGAIHFEVMDDGSVEQLIGQTRLGAVAPKLPWTTNYYENG